MIKVALTANLKTYYPESRFEMDALSLRELLASMDRVRPRFSHYILEDHNKIRRHVNIFVNGQVLTDKTDIDTELPPGAEVHIMQALSGG